MKRTSRLHRTVRAGVTGWLVVCLLLAVVPQSEKQTCARNTQIVLLLPRLQDGCSSARVPLLCLE
jgi:hypothetical protein